MARNWLTHCRGENSPGAWGEWHVPHACSYDEDAFDHRAFRSVDVALRGTHPARWIRCHTDPASVTVPVDCAAAADASTPARINFVGSWYAIVGESGERYRSSSTWSHVPCSPVSLSGVAGVNVASAAPPGDAVSGTVPTVYTTGCPAADTAAGPVGPAAGGGTWNTNSAHTTPRATPIRSPVPGPIGYRFIRIWRFHLRQPSPSWVHSVDPRPDLRNGSRIATRAGDLRSEFEASIRGCDR